MSRTQSFTPLLRPLALPRPCPCRQRFRLSTAPRLQAERVPSPSTPHAARRAADLAAAEALTEADSAQPPEPKPALPSNHTDPTSADTSPRPTTSRLQPSLSPAQAEADIAIALANMQLAAQKPKPSTSTLLQPHPKSPFQARKFKPESRTQKTARLAAAAKVPPPSSTTSRPVFLLPPRYHIARSATKNLPVYTDTQRGGNLRSTTVRKITGDVGALREELRVWLGRGHDEVRVNGLTGHVVVKGHCKADVDEFLRRRGM